ncbi:MAG: 6-phosphogluconolactonase [Leptolyngbyaceae bacterium]|nr:6-phosphogluconolactonase [Leptolyngbyaceae bacterium]
MARTVEILADKSALVQRALEIVVERIRGAIAQRDLCTIALAGGSTPKPLYEAIATQDLPWEKIHVFWGDERYVPADHPDSNELMARTAWLNQVDIPDSNIHAVPTDEADPAVAAAKHDKELQEFFGVSSGVFPEFDIILLGMGDDGHTASLFPHTEALTVGDRLITVGNKGDSIRITFTAPFINQSRCVIFMVAGENKQDALSHVFAEEDDSNQYPSRLIQPKGEFIWLLDQSAGENLE